MIFVLSFMRTDLMSMTISAQLQGQQTETAAAEVEQYETEDLSEYTNTELKQMYHNGDITRQEYENETGETLE